MRSVAIYACRSKSNAFDRNELIFDQLDSALTARAELDRHELGRRDRKPLLRPRSLPGLTTVRSREPIVALGRVAHTALADFEKRTLIVEDLDLGGPQDATPVDDLEQFVWSCANTSRIVALGCGAWHSVQLLPIADRRFHRVPPLRFARSEPAVRSILVIDHEEEGTRGKALVGVLQRARMDVAYTGPGASGDMRCWSSGALIHVHVGDHTLDSEAPRLVDSWRSEKLVLQLADDRRLRRVSNGDVLMIENEVNGVICATPEDVVSACRELHDDRVLQKKLIAAGQSTVAPLVKGWGAIADDLLS